MSVDRGNGDRRPILEIRGAVKKFGAVNALRGVDLMLGKREVLALLGDNGAGKSTLIKCISGAHRLDGGRIFVDGDEVALRHPSDARRLGIETVYQDLALFDNLNATANFYAGRELSRPSWLGGAGVLKDKAMDKEAKALLDRLQVRLRSNAAPVALMSGGQRQAVAVARAVAFAKSVVILDEPTAALGLRESQNVLSLIRRLPENGIAVILISHNLEHVMQVADRAVVLRQGSIVGEATPTSANHELLVSWIVGSASTNNGFATTSQTSPKGNEVRDRT